MPHKDIAVVVAMRRELAPLLRGVQAQQADGVEFFERESAVVAIGGIGRSAAHRAAEAVVAKYSPGMLISAGIAGALSPVLKVGDIVRSRGAVDAVTGTVFSAGGDALVVTVSSVNGAVEKRTIAQRWKSVDVVDMEAAAVAEVAERRGIWFFAIKAISDEVDFLMPPVGQFVDGSGRFETLRFATYVAARPKWWSAVRQLNLNSRTASVKLCEALQHLIDQQLGNVSEGKSVGAL
jgi:adenosylhomocysteine nucleosidase